MERAVLVYTTWPSIVEAEAAGRTIVERRLAACVNILPRVVPISQLGGSLQSGCSRGDYSDALFASSRGAPTSNCDVGYCPDNGHSEVASRRPLSAMCGHSAVSVGLTMGNKCTAEALNCV